MFSAPDQFARINTGAPKRPQFGDGTPVPGHHHCLAAFYALEYLSPAITQIAHCYIGHHRSVSPVRHCGARCLSIACATTESACSQTLRLLEHDDGCPSVRCESPHEQTHRGCHLGPLSVQG